MPKHTLVMRFSVKPGPVGKLDAAAFTTHSMRTVLELSTRLPKEVVERVGCSIEVVMGNPAIRFCFYPTEDEPIEIGDPVSYRFLTRTATPDPRSLAPKLIRVLMDRLEEMEKIKKAIFGPS